MPKQLDMKNLLAEFARVKDLNFGDSRIIAGCVNVEPSMFGKVSNIATCIKSIKAADTGVVTVVYKHPAMPITETVKGFLRTTFSDRFRPNEHLIGTSAVFSGIGKVGDRFYIHLTFSAADSEDNGFNVRLYVDRRKRKTGHSFFQRLENTRKSIYSETCWRNMFNGADADMRAALGLADRDYKDVRSKTFQEMLVSNGYVSISSLTKSDMMYHDLSDSCGDLLDKDLHVEFSGGTFKLLPDAILSELHYIYGVSCVDESGNSPVFIFDTHIVKSTKQEILAKLKAGTDEEIEVIE